jgi:dihydroflavonol-4-reductase
MIAITGASGHLGTTLIKRLKKNGVNYTGFYRQPSNLENSFVGELDDESSLLSFFKGKKVVVHSAGIVWPRLGLNHEVERVNYLFTKIVYEAAVKSGVEHFIFISSIHSMVDDGEGRVDELSDLCSDPIRSYGFSKAESERFLNDRDEMTISIINPTGIIGENDYYYNSGNQMFKLFSDNKLPVLPSGGYNFVDVDDVVNVIVSVIDKKIPGKFIAGGEFYEISDIIKLYAEIVGKKAPRFKLPIGVMNVIAFFTGIIQPFFKKPLPSNKYTFDTLMYGGRNIDCRKIYRELGVEKTDIKVTLEKINKWIS